MLEQFSEQRTNARTEQDSDRTKKRGDPYKQKSNSFYGMTVKYLDGNKNTKFLSFQKSITQIAEDRNQVRMQKKKVDQKRGVTSVE